MYVIYNLLGVVHLIMIAKFVLPMLLAMRGRRDRRGLRCPDDSDEGDLHRKESEI